MADALTDLTSRVSSPISFNISQSTKTARPDLVSEDIGSLQQLFNSIGSAYDSLVARGREQDASQLRDAAERFAAIGSKMGVNESTRVRSLTELKNRMNVASRFAESKILADKLNSQAGLLGKMASLRGAAWDQASTQAGWTENAVQEVAQQVLAPRGAMATSNTTRSPIAGRQTNSMFDNAFYARSDKILADAKQEADRSRDIQSRTQFYMSKGQGYDYKNARMMATQDVDKLWSTPTGVASSELHGPTTTVTRPLGKSQVESPLQSTSQPFTLQGTAGNAAGMTPMNAASGSSVPVSSASPLSFTQAQTPAGTNVGRLTDAAGNVKGQMTINGMNVPAVQAPTAAAKQAATRGPGGLNPAPVKKKPTRGPGGVTAPKLDPYSLYFPPLMSNPFTSNRT